MADEIRCSNKCCQYVPDNRPGRDGSWYAAWGYRIRRYCPNKPERLNADGSVTPMVPASDLDIVAEIADATQADLEAAQAEAAELKRQLIIAHEDASGNFALDTARLTKLQAEVARLREREEKLLTLNRQWLRTATNLVSQIIGESLDPQTDPVTRINQELQAAGAPEPLKEE